MSSPSRLPPPGSAHGTAGGTPNAASAVLAKLNLYERTRPSIGPERGARVIITTPFVSRSHNMCSSPSDGGSAAAWEQCLLEPLNPDDTCPICYDVMVTPSYGCRNKHNACKECFQDYLNTDAEGSVRCPGGCGQRISTIQTNTAREATINRLPARCRHSNLGCKWEGSFGG